MRKRTLWEDIEKYGIKRRAYICRYNNEYESWDKGRRDAFFRYWARYRDSSVWDMTQEAFNKYLAWKMCWLYLQYGQDSYLPDASDVRNSVFVKVEVDSIDKRSSLWPDLKEGPYRLIPGVLATDYVANINFSEGYLFMADSGKKLRITNFEGNFDGKHISGENTYTPEQMKELAARYEKA